MDLSEKRVLVASHCNSVYSECEKCPLYAECQANGRWSIDNDEGLENMYKAYRAMKDANSTNPTTTPKKPLYDPVNSPKHYASTSVECIDMMAETQGTEAVIHFCICNAFKYLWRHNSKNGTEDIKKASWYLNKAVELMEKEKK